MCVYWSISPDVALDKLNRKTQQKKLSHSFTYFFFQFQKFETEIKLEFLFEWEKIFFFLFKIFVQINKSYYWEIVINQIGEMIHT